MRKSVEDKRKYVASIIFSRISAQMAGVSLGATYWEAAYEGWKENPALFPLVEACIDAADEILTFLEDEAERREPRAK